MGKELVVGQSTDQVLRSDRENLSAGKVDILPPIGVELFFTGQNPESNLSPEIASNSRLIEQAASRRTLYNLFSQVFEAIPDPNLDITKAVKEGLIDKSVVVALWDGISDFLEQDENNARILLYLPFEILPDLTIQDSKLEDMMASGQRLGNLYWQRWIRLLHEAEPRANFVDGDVLEPGLGRPEMISKAGHLTPELLTKGIIEVDNIVVLLEAISDIRVSKSLIEGVIVAKEKGLMDDLAWDKIKEIIKRKNSGEHVVFSREKYYGDPNSNRISPERARWLRKILQEGKDNKEADQLSQQLVDGLISLTGLTKNRVSALAVFKSGEQLSKRDSAEARKFSEHSQKLIKRLWESDDTAIKDVIIGGLNHWVRLRIVDRDYLDELGIELADLSLPSQYNEERLSQEFDYLKIAAQKIKEHPVLSKALYPTFLVFGSRLKGYADINADVDAAVFFRPEVKFEDREQILEILKSDVPGIANLDNLLEYWMLAENGKLKFKMPKEDTRIFVGEDQIHFFMGGAWIGCGEEFMRIRNNILERYLDLSRFGEQKEGVRAQLLGQLELDVLQCRLMHKGYRKYYPSHKREGTPNSHLIDWKGDFWDPGYRRIATKLFVSRVFLPDLAEIKTAGENVGQ